MLKHWLAIPIAAYALTMTAAWAHERSTPPRIVKQTEFTTIEYFFPPQCLRNDDLITERPTMARMQQIVESF